MKTIIVKRVTTDLDWATFGVMKYNRVPFAVTIERAWKNNEKMISAIPCGLYTMQRRAATSNIPYVHFVLLNVPGNRDGIAIHKANLASQLEGCIAVGESFDPVSVKGNPEEPGIAQSGEGFREFMEILNGDDIAQLQVTE